MSPDELNQHVRTVDSERLVKKIAQPTLRRIAKAIDHLGNDPRPSGATALQGESGLMRIRVGDFRIIYRIHDDVLTVLVVTIGHRRGGGFPNSATEVPASNDVPAAVTGTAISIASGARK